MKKQKSANEQQSDYIISFPDPEVIGSVEYAWAV